jgi:predicted ABC-type ATPase
MFAGPNGSGKTTVKNQLPSSLFGMYINPDEIEKNLHETGKLDLNPFDISIEPNEIRNWFISSDFLKSLGLAEDARLLRCKEGVLELNGLRVNSYYASVLSDWLRRKLIAALHSFTFETVMSSHDKVTLLRSAKQLGYRTYLYFVATEDPLINVARVNYRVTQGGHDVPQNKIIDRYHRSLGLLREAIRYTDRAFFFDTSSLGVDAEIIYVAEITDGMSVDVKVEAMPNWFRAAVWDQF